MKATKRGRLGKNLPGLGVCLVLACATVGLSACGNTVQLRGNTPDPEDVAAIQPGVQSRQDIIDLLGSPSTVSTFQDRKWYYIGQKTEEIAFMKPTVIDRKVLVITFDESGLVESTRNYTMADAQDVDPVDRETPTEGRDLTLLQQLFGNIGRFSSPL
ncbi:outer membrane protein assembly factor BamE [Pelagibius marinus]|uniref:outer membrane protein assembly factor BamE n=1 Tax=Pelagibius marinus TaxID=2762760 RepID=UPI001872F3B4|nr:outer membrane protein assembly factor BamE [Pelagibius marinus]